MMKARYLLIGVVILFAAGILTTQSYANIDPNTIVGMWLFDEDSGNIATDSSGNGNDGELMNSPMWVDGKFGKALSFDGINDYVSIVSSLSGLPDFTYAEWVWIDSSGSDDSLVIQTGNGEIYYYPSTHKFWINIYSNRAGGPGPTCYWSIFAVNGIEDKWTHLSFVGRSDNTAEFYVNGTSVPIGPRMPDSPSWSHNYATIGAGRANWGYVGTGYWFKGSIDEVAVFNKALATADINSIMTQGLEKAITAGGIGTLTGKITDSSTGNAINGATITLEGYTTTTDLDGNYILTVPTGTYSVIASSPGYKGQTQNNITVGMGQSIIIDFPLKPIGYAIVVAGQAKGSNDFIFKIKALIDRCANNVYKSLRNLGFDDEHIIYLNDVSQMIDNKDVRDYNATFQSFMFSLSEVKSRLGSSPAPITLYLIGHGDNDTFTFRPGNNNDSGNTLSSFNLRNMLDIFSSNRMHIFIMSCKSGSFITRTISIDSISIREKERVIITGAHDEADTDFATVKYYELARFSDRLWKNLMNGLSIKAAFINKANDHDKKFSWLDDNGDEKGHSPDNLQSDGELAAITKIGIPNSEHFPLDNWLFWWLKSPGEIRVYDSQSRICGKVNGAVKEEIPNSFYDEEDEAIIMLDSSDSYRCDVVGTDNGTYGLEVSFVKDGEPLTFIANNILTSPGATHQYNIDWNILSQGGQGVTIKMDSNGDGVFEQKIATGNTFIYVPATIDLDPDTLNLKSKGQWITCYIELPDEYDVKKIITSSICLCVGNGKIFAETKPLQIGDYDKDGISDLMVKFDRNSLIEYLKNTDHISDSIILVIYGQIESDIWGGNYTIKIIGSSASSGKPEEFALLQNFPNSFNPETWIPYQLAEDVDVAIRIYSVSGQLVKTLQLGYKQAGFYTERSKAAYWDGKNELGEQVASGIYFYQIKAGDFVATRKFVMLK